jgi:hypothetical protein
MTLRGPWRRGKEQAMGKLEEQDARIEAILGKAKNLTFNDAMDRFYQCLQSSLELPCAVTGSQDFDWEEIYVFGEGDPDEYAELRKTQPSYRDTYDLLSIEKGVRSEWMLFPFKDIAAHVRRRSDGKEFVLGLAELKAVDRNSVNEQLLDDYVTWFGDNQ